MSSKKREPCNRMRKKKQNLGASTATVKVLGADLKSLIHSHREFFDHLVELIPAKFYLPNDEESKPWYQGLSKAAKASLKQQSKQNLKLARRNRFNPDSQPSSSTLNLQQQQITKATLPEEENFVDLEEDRELVDHNKESASVTYEELRQKLRRKIELLRGNRGASGEKKIDGKPLKNDEKKRKRGDENAGGESGQGVELEEDDDGEEIIEYGKVRLGEDEEGKTRRKKKGKLSKPQELERAKRLQEVKREKPGIAERQSWKAATSRAMGVKVHDDARLIKESMKREKRKKEKSAGKWNERVETQEKMKGQRQQKRKENIVGRIKEKKMRKIAKREKKLMRPGFEGRKDNYITQE